MFSPGRGVCVQNRYAAIAEDEVQVPETEEHVMSDGSGTTLSCQETEQVRSAPVTRRLRLVWDRATHRDVRAAEGLLRNMATRIGGLSVGSDIPRAVRQQRWSPMNVPLMWGRSGW